MPLFELALIKQPTKKEAEDGKLEELILPPTPVLAKDDRAAALQAILNNKDKVGTDISQVQVLVRPFA
jgi:hypothetical protein